VYLLAVFVAGICGAAQAYEPKATRVVDNVYAVIGPTSGRTAENDALNNNLGFVVTDAGVVLIDSGASRQGAEKIDAAIAQVTDKPVTHVINTGSQDHRWLGNGYFRDQGAQIIALARTVKTQERFAEQHLDSLRQVLGDGLAGTEPAYAQAPADGDRLTIEIGGLSFELIWFGDAHFPGDVVVWLPAQKVLFTGDMVYVDRMLGIHPWSDVTAWRNAFHAMESLEPSYIVPGHGQVTDLAQARGQTGDYLDFLVTETSAAVENFDDLQATVERLSDAPGFKNLEHFDNWHRTNISRTFTQLEAKSVE
jgi:glyoxylase-like metal-dependent hydrolase (beta-lactamase superfamily II)